jgi:hypothetical protein
MAKKKSLKTKELTKLRKLVKELKSKRKRKSGVSQKVSQKVIIGNKPFSGDAGRNFPQIQFLQQPQPQMIDTQLLREFFTQKNMSPLTRPVLPTAVQNPNNYYSLSDQYGIGLDNPVNLGVPVDVNNDDDDSSFVTDDSALSMDTNIDRNERLRPAPQNQGNLDNPFQPPRAPAIGRLVSDETGVSRMSLNDRVRQLPNRYN